MRILSKQHLYISTEYVYESRIIVCLSIGSLLLTIQNFIATKLICLTLQPKIQRVLTRLGE